MTRQSEAQEKKRKSPRSQFGFAIRRREVELRGEKSDKGEEARGDRTMKTLDS